MASRGSPRRKRKFKLPCPYDGKTVMSMKHALMIVARAPEMEPYTCPAGYIHVGNISKRPPAKEQP